MMEAASFLFLVGRILLGGYFLLAGVSHFRNRAMMAQFAASKGTPFPMLAVVGTGVLLLVGGLSLASGVYPLLGLGTIALFLVGTTPVMHAFWKVTDPAARMAEVSSFTRNAALLGAVLILAALPRPWDLAVPALVLGGP